MAGFTDEELAIYGKVRDQVEQHKESKSRADRKPVLAIRFENFAQLKEFVQNTLDLDELGVFYADGLDAITVTHIVGGLGGGGRHRAI